MPSGDVNVAAKAPSAKARRGPAKNLEAGLAIVRKLLAGPDMLAPAAFARRVGASENVVDQWRRDGLVLALTDPSDENQIRYPAWQLDAKNKPLKGLSELIKFFGDEWELRNFLTQSHGALGGATGIEALAAGRAEEVRGLARAIAEGAFS